ncbi:cupin [Candidatus Pacearchaeota archaeon]|nr:cupin [Candidatus Pacearchaeota archaeon]
MVKRVDKPWGYEEWLEVNESYVMKRIFINRGRFLSLQYHERKTETVCVVRGMVELTLGNLTPFGYELFAPRVMHPKDVIHLPPRTIHRFKALENAVLIEASTPELDDVVRLDDDYGRKGTNET